MKITRQILRKSWKGEFTFQTLQADDHGLAVECEFDLKSLIDHALDDLAGKVSEVLQAAKEKGVGGS